MLADHFENDSSLTFLLSSASLHLTSAGASLIGDIVIVGGLFTAGFIIISKRFNIFTESSEGRINAFRFDYFDFSNLISLLQNMLVNHLILKTVVQQNVVQATKSSLRNKIIQS